MKRFILSMILAVGFNSNAQPKKGDLIQHHVIPYCTHKESGFLSKEFSYSVQLCGQSLYFVLEKFTSSTTSQNRLTIVDYINLDKTRYESNFLSPHACLMKNNTYPFAFGVGVLKQSSDNEIIGKIKLAWALNLDASKIVKIVPEKIECALSVED